MQLIQTKCTNCGADLEVNNSSDTVVCEYCGSSFIVNESSGGHRRNNPPAEAQTIATIEERLAAAEKLIKENKVSAGFLDLWKIARDFPGDYRPLFLRAKYEYECNGVWLDNNDLFFKARELADEDGREIIDEYRDGEYEKILEKNKSIVEFADRPDYSKLNYTYLKWYYSKSHDPSERSGYIGIEPVNGVPTVVSYGEHPKYTYIRRELAYHCKLIKTVHNKNIVIPVMNEDFFVGLPYYTTNEFVCQDKKIIGSWDVLKSKDCRLYITGFDSTGRVIYNDSPKEMLYGDVLKAKSTEYEKTGGPCYIATCVYGSYDCPPVWTLRRFRDDFLAKSRGGRAFIRTYYAVGPKIVKLFGQTEWFNRFFRSVLNKFVKHLRAKGFEDSPYTDK